MAGNKRCILYSLSYFETKKLNCRRERKTSHITQNKQHKARYLFQPLLLY